MLEKIGLPPKPSMRGSNWVIDASHCQGCSSQFTFLNRKHHCRRCGGLFCNSCTQQRMILRGQGDSPVRICDPCKKLEEAARFEMRYGQKNRAGKGGTKLLPKHEDDVLNEILGSDGKRPFSSARESSTDMLSDLQRSVSSASCSNLDGETVTQDRKADTFLSSSIDMHNHAINETESSSPEELRQQALEEKKKYRVLKGEGKSDEALQAFKRGKELERQAGGLELALRKSRRKASTLTSLAASQKTNDNDHESGRKDNLFSKTGKEVKDDLAAELRELGWSDVDMHDADNKPVKISLEGELSSLLGEIPKKSSLGKGTTSIDKTQVLTLKKKALMYKREGKLAEAKEELKRAKVLEKQLEDQELLADADESDDELSALIRNMDDYDDDKHDGLSMDYMKDPGFDMANLVGAADGLAFDGNFDVTDDDMNNPEIAAALKSFGWTEDAYHLDDTVSESVPMDAEALQSEVLSLKREALNLKRAGNVAQAMEQLKKAKLLERDLENLQSDDQSTSTKTSTVGSNSTQRNLNPQTDTADDAIITTMKPLDKSPPKSKLAIQRELLGLKKKALALRREGRMDEAEEELNKGKVLERQLEELENAPKSAIAKTSLDRKDLEPFHKHKDVTEDANVTEQDMHDPALLSVLKNLGWDDEEVETVREQKKSSKEIINHSEHATNMKIKAEIPDRRPKSKAEIQRELLSIKRKALTLRRQGKSEEAEEELRMATALEAQLAEMEAASQKENMHDSGFSIPREKYENVEKGNAVERISLNDEDVMVEVSEADMNDPGLANALQDMGWKESNPIQPPFVSSSISVGETSQPSEEMFWSVAKHVDTVPQANQSINAMDLLTGNVQRESDFLIPKTVNDGNSDTSISHLANTRAHLEASLNLKAKAGAEVEISSANVLYHMADKIEKPITDVEKTAPGSDAQNDHSSRLQEVLARKRKAVALKREGKLAEAREELRQAKLLEKSLEEAAHHANAGNINISASTSNATSVSPESSTKQAPKPISSRDRFKLQQESLAHKRQAMKLRREGRMEESEAELELAKALEAQLEEMGTLDPYQNKSKNKMEADNDVGVEDLLDPQLMTALKSIGWQDVDVVKQVPQRSEAQPNVVKNASSSQEKSQLEERIKAEKVRALNLKKAGKQAEALDALRQAKQLEKKLNSMAS